MKFTTMINVLQRSVSYAGLIISVRINKFKMKGILVFTPRGVIKVLRAKIIIVPCSFSL